MSLDMKRSLYSGKKYTAKPGTLQEETENPSS